MSSKAMQFATYKRMLSVMWWRHGEDYVGLQHPGMYSAILCRKRICVGNVGLAEYSVIAVHMPFEKSGTLQSRRLMIPSTFISPDPTTKSNT